jgi:hypothetical protein
MAWLTIIGLLAVGCVVSFTACLLLLGSSERKNNE